MNKSSKKPESQDDNSFVSPDNIGSNQNRSGIMDNAPGKSDDLFEDQNVPSEGEVGNAGNNPNTKDDEKALNGVRDSAPENEVDDDAEVDVNVEDEDDVDFDSENDDIDLDDDAIEDADQEDDLEDEEDFLT